MATTTLQAIVDKVRRLTRSPSANQITDAEIYEYVNTFFLYDFPEHLRLDTLRTTLEFYTSPNIDLYENNTTDTTQPLYNFINEYTTFHPPLFIAGYPSLWSQDRTQFYGIYPQVNSIQDTGLTGDSVTTVFTGTIATVPLLENNFLLTSQDVNGAALVMKDVPVVDAGTGLPTLIGNLYTPDNVPATPPTAVDATNTINYITGVFTVTFPSAPVSAEPIKSQSIPYTAARPTAALYYQNTFILRPVPDKAYKVSIEAYRQPTELLASGDRPELDQWWQMIAFGASLKVLEDKSQYDDRDALMPLFKEQERLVLRKTLQQQSNTRAATIYSEQSGLGSSFDGYRNW